MTVPGGSSGRTHAPGDGRPTPDRISGFRDVPQPEAAGRGQRQAIALERDAEPVAEDRQHVAVAHQGDGGDHDVGDRFHDREPATRRPDSTQVWEPRSPTAC